jgi:predicted lipoprotein with Yx(FWY)xxD motif
MFRSPALALRLAAVAGLLTVAACGAGTAAPSAGSAPSTAAQQHAGHGAGSHANPLALFAVQTAPLGTVATDGLGHLLYRFDKDTSAPSASACMDACTQTWKPLLVEKGHEPEFDGVPAKLVGRFTRPEGTQQLTLNGWPLYTHRDDDGELRTAGANGTDGAWFAVTPTGEKASAPK